MQQRARVAYTARRHSQCNPTSQFDETLECGQIRPFAYDCANTVTQPANANANANANTPTQTVIHALVKVTSASCRLGDSHAEIVSCGCPASGDEPAQIDVHRNNNSTPQCRVSRLLSVAKKFQERLRFLLQRADQTHTHTHTHTAEDKTFV